MKPIPPPSAPAPACPPVQGKGTSTSTTTNSWYVKIYMDGVPFGRKVDLKTNNSYEKLYPALEEMFQQFINGTHHIFCVLNFCIVSDVHITKPKVDDVKDVIMLRMSFY